MRLSVLRFKWDVMVSVALSRPQVIAAPMSEIEKRFHSLQMEEERERSLLNDFELKTRHDKKLLAKRAELEREGKELSELDEQIGLANTIIQDEWNRRGEQLVQSLQLANPRSREVNDDRSLRRKLDRKLLLIVKQRFGQENYKSPWILPQLKHETGETLRETAERCIRQCADGVTASIYGNAPFAVFTQKYPKPLAKRLDKAGAKLFFYHAALAPTSSFEPNKKEGSRLFEMRRVAVEPVGDAVLCHQVIHCSPLKLLLDSIENQFKAALSCDDKVVDYKWVVREEFWSTVPSKKYKSCVNSVFLE